MAPTPTPTPTSAHERGREGVSAPTPTAATPPLPRGGNMRTPKSRQKPPRTPSSRRAGGDSSAAATPSSGAAERLADELLGTPSLSVGDRQEAFESARKKFAMYGKQNAHVSHYSPDQQQRQRFLKRPASGDGDSTATPVARRVVDWGDDSSSANATALQNTVLLQENGELATQLDDIEYHLDGILARPIGGVEAEERGYAAAASVVALVRLLLLEQIQTAIKVSSQSAQLYTRLRDVLLLLKSLDHRMLKLSTAVLAFLLTTSADADEYFSEDVIDAVVAALVKESERLGAGASDSREQSTLVSNAVSDSKTPLKKSFLKRKKSGPALLRRAASSTEDAFADGFESGPSATDRARVFAQRDEQLLDDLRSLLEGHDAFVVDGEIQLSIADLLCMLLHNILQIGGAPATESSDVSFNKASGKQSIRRFHQRQDFAGTTFATIMSRKQQLIKNGGLDILLRLLEHRFNSIRSELDSDVLQISVSLELANAFQRLRTMLRVLDQASFLASDVQLHMSKDETIFCVTIKMVETLSLLAWSFKSRRKWLSDPSFMQLVVDVLMASLRVIINLSHQNEDANRHIAKVRGTNALFLAFCKLWGTTELIQASARSSEYPGMEEKVVYDALLLILSAITNCVEYSEENRTLLSKLDLSKTTLEGLDAFRSSSPCSLLVAFFVTKVQSYLHLIRMTDSQHELDGESWVPEDVILGGCTSLLLGCMMKDSSYNTAIILGALPDGSPRLLLRALGAFVALHSQIGALTPEVGKSVLEVDKLLKSFMFEGVGMSTPSPAKTNAKRALKMHSLTEASEISGLPAMQTEITLRVKAPLRSIEGAVKVEKAVDDDNDVDMDEESQRSRLSQQSLRSPPASAFKLQRFSRVCSSADDSDDVISDRDPSPVKKKRPTPTPSNQSRSVGKSKVTLTATVTLTPVRRASDSAITRNELDKSPARSSTQRRLKRTRRLVSDLEAEFMKIGNRVSMEINAAGMQTSTEDGDDGNDVDFSQDLFSTDDPRFALATPAKLAKMVKTNSAVKTPNVVRPFQKAADAKSTPISHKRKVKATPSKANKKDAAQADGDTVFDFPG